MGIGFVILLHFIAIFVISCIIAVISGLITFFVSNKDKKKRKVFLAVFTPFQGLYTLYILALVGSIIVSETKNVDIGIGDSWFVPLSENCQILMIDLPEQAYLQCDGQSIINDVSDIQQIDNRVYGKTFNDEFFAFNMANNKFEIYSTETELIDEEKIVTLDLIKTSKFYQDRRWEVSGTATIIVGILSLIITIMIIIVFCRLVLYGWKLGIKKN